MIFFIHSFWISCLSPDSFRHCSNLSLRRAESPDEDLLKITLDFCTFGQCSFEPSLIDSFQSQREYLYKGRLLSVEYASDFKHITDVFDSTIGWTTREGDLTSRARTLQFNLSETKMNNLESDDEAVDTPLVSPFPHSDNDSDDEEVLNELSEYENAGTLRQERIINSTDGDDLGF
ncbi:hypothetical protein Tco_0428724 [Tanacetum coccineum]